MSRRNAFVGWDADLGAPTTFLLLRHGETQHTIERRFSGGVVGQGDPGLSERGLAQAQAAATHLKELAAAEPGTHHAAHPSVDAVVASPMRRTRETAEVVAVSLGLDVTVEQSVRECDFGRWDGLTYEDVLASDPALLTEWFASTSAAPPGGENFEDVQQRIAEARDALMARYAGQTVLVVTHVTPIKSMVRLVLDAPTNALYRMEVSPASLTSIQWFADGVASLRFFNDTWHLRDLDGHHVL